MRVKICPTQPHSNAAEPDWGGRKECKIQSPYTGFAFIRGNENIMPSAYNTTLYPALDGKTN